MVFEPVFVYVLSICFILKAIAFRKASRLTMSELFLNLANAIRFEINTYRGYLPMPGWWFYYNYYNKDENWPEDGDLEENNDMKEPNIICIFSLITRAWNLSFNVFREHKHHFRKFN